MVQAFDLSHQQHVAATAIQPAAAPSSPLVPVAMAFAVGVLVASAAPVLSTGLASSTVPTAASLGARLTAWPSAGLTVPVAVVVMAAVGMALTARSARLSMAALLALWMALGSLRAVVAALPPAHWIAPLVPEQPALAAVHGLVANDPLDPLGPAESEPTVCVIEVDFIRIGGAWRPAAGRLRARLARAPGAIHFGDELLIEGLLSRPPAPGNPGQYDWRASLARQGIAGLLAVRPHDPVVRLATGRGVWWFQAIDALRSRWEALLDGHFSPARAGLLRSLLLGQRVAMDERVKRAFVETGTIHLLVISGSNVGLLAGILELWLRLLGAPRRTRLLVNALALAGYATITGLQPPVLRATLMAWLVLLALGLDRAVLWPNLLAAAGLVMLAVDPRQLFDGSFQLSFGAVTCLLLFVAPLQQRLNGWLSWRWLSWLRPAPRQYLSAGLATTVAMWIGQWPLLFWSFWLFSPVSLLANLVLVPLMSVLVGCGTVMLLVGSMASGVVAWCRWPLGWLVDATVVCVLWCHRLPYGCWVVGRPPWWAMTGYYLWLLAWLARRPLRLSSRALALAGGISLAAGLWVPVIERAITPPRTDILALDVGHGDSLVIRTPDHRTLLIDAGTRDAGKFAVVPYLKSRGWTRLAALIVTHPDEDHLGGALAVLEELRVDRLLTNGTLADTTLGRAVLELAARRRVREESLHAGMQLTGMGDLAMMVLHPPPALVPGEPPRSNDNSLVLRLDDGRSSVLLTGDLEERGVPWVLAWEDRFVRADVVKVPHHGSRLGAAGPRWAQRTGPKVAVLSVGTLHGLPAASTLAELSAAGSRVLSTREHGAIAVSMRHDGIAVRTTKTDTRIVMRTGEGG